MPLSEMGSTRPPRTSTASGEGVAASPATKGTIAVVRMVRASLRKADVRSAT